MSSGARGSDPPGAFATQPASWIVGLGALLVVIAIASELSGSRWSFLPDQRLRTDAAWFFLLAVVVLRPRTPPVALVAAGVAVAGFVLVHQFLSVLGSHLVFSDDHSTFFYRLTILDRHFPDLATYNTGWNAGVLTTDLFVTGAVLLYLLAAPLFAVAEPESCYNVLIGGTFAAVLPWSSWAAGRVLGAGRRTSCAAAFLAIGPSLMLYRWALAYGTVPFVVVSFLTPLLYALAVRTIRADVGWIRWGVPFGILLNAVMFWSGSVFLVGPVALLLLFDLPPDRRLARLSRLALVSIVVLVANLWWLVEYFRLIPLGRFLGEGTTTGVPAPPAHPFGAGVTARTAWGVLQKTNPLLLALTVVGLAGGRDRPSRNLALLAGAFFVMATVGPQLARHLELDRMALPMSLCLTLPAAVGLRLLWSAPGRAGRAAGPALVAVTVAFTGLSARTYWANEAIERFTPLEAPVEELVARIREHSRGGRTYFAGFVLHDFSNGHAAGLQRLAGVPMVAVEPMHRYWWYRDPLPPAFRRSPEGLREYLRLLNADLAVSTDTAWRRRLEADEAFDLLWESAGYALFRFREFPDDWFLEGDGEVEEIAGGLRVRLASDEAVLRYAAVPGLTAGPGARIGSTAVGGLDWIRLRAPRSQWIEVRLP